MRSFFRRHYIPIVPSHRAGLKAIAFLCGETLELITLAAVVASKRRMESKLIHAHAPLLPPHIACSDDCNHCRCVEHCSETRTGTINIQIAVGPFHWWRQVCHAGSA